MSTVLLQKLMNDLDDVKSALTTQNYLNLCALLQVMYEANKMEATCDDDILARNIRASRRSATDSFRIVISTFRKLQEAGL